MAKKNAYLAKQAAVNHGYFTAGLQSGRQQILDLFLERYEYAPEFDYNKGKWK